MPRSEQCHVGVALGHTKTPRMPRMLKTGAARRHSLITDLFHMPRKALAHAALQPDGGFVPQSMRFCAHDHAARIVTPAAHAGGLARERGRAGAHPCRRPAAELINLGERCVQVPTAALLLPAALACATSWRVNKARAVRPKHLTSSAGSRGSARTTRRLRVGGRERAL